MDCVKTKINLVDMLAALYPKHKENTESWITNFSINEESSYIATIKIFEKKKTNKNSYVKIKEEAYASGGKLIEEHKAMYFNGTLEDHHLFWEIFCDINGLID